MPYTRWKDQAFHCFAVDGESLTTNNSKQIILSSLNCFASPNNSRRSTFS